MLAKSFVLDCDLKVKDKRVLIKSPFNFQDFNAIE